MDYYVSVTISLVIYNYFQICTENPFFSLLLLFNDQSLPYPLKYDYSTSLTMKLCLLGTISMAKMSFDYKIKFYYVLLYSFMVSLLIYGFLIVLS